MSALESIQRCLQSRVRGIITGLGVIYGFIEFTAFRIDRSVMLKPVSKIITTSIAGVFATAYLATFFFDLISAWFGVGWRETWKRKKDIEKMSVSIAGVCVVAGWGAWLSGACRQSNKSWQIWLLVGYLLGTTGQSFQLISGFVKNRREIKRSNVPG
jgi:hypothetical protein